MAGTLCSVVDGDRRNLELSELEVLRVGDCLGAGTWATRLGVRIRVAGPRTAERDVEDELVVLEVLADVTATGAEERHGSGPRRRVGLAVLDVLGDLLTSELPDGDAGRVHAVSSDAASLLVELRAEGVGVRREDAAAGVIAIGRRTSLANDVSSESLALGGDLGHGLQRSGTLVPVASWAGVQGDLVVLRVMDAFQEIDLSVERPWSVAKRPVRGPGATSVGSSEEIGDEESLVVGILGGDAYGFAEIVVDELVGGIDSEDNGVVRLYEGETARVGLGLVHERNETLGRVGAGEEVPIVEEILSCIFLLENVV